MEKEPQIEVDVLIFDDVRYSKLLLYQNADRMWQLPSVKIQEGESAFDAAARAVKTDTGMEIDAEKCRYGSWSYDSKYRCYIIYICRKNQLKSCADNSQWFAINKLPEELNFLKRSIDAFIKLKKIRGFSFFIWALIMVFCLGYGAVNYQSILPIANRVNEFLGMNIFNFSSNNSNSIGYQDNSSAISTELTQSQHCPSPKKEPDPYQTQVKFTLGKQLGFSRGAFSIMQGDKQIASIAMDAGYWNFFRPSNDFKAGEYQICFSGVGSTEASSKGSESCSCKYNFSVEIGRNQQSVILSQSSLVNWTANSVGACGMHP